jgi:hypothetical protein
MPETDKIVAELQERRLRDLKSSQGYRDSVINELKQIRSTIEECAPRRWERKSSREWKKERLNVKIKEESKLKARLEELAGNVEKYAIPVTELGFEFTREFEVRGVDVMLRARVFSVHHDGYEIRDEGAAIEIKPTIGDDYPAVLRQMKVNKSTVLFLREYVGKGATKEQFIKTFELSDMRVVFKRDVERIENPGSQ